MVEINVTYKGDLRCEAVHGPSGSKINTDAPTDNMGKGELFSPTDLVATALGTCILTTMAIVAKRHGIDFGAARLHVSKEMVTQPIRRIGKLPVDIYLPFELTAEQKQRLENAAHSCPVHHSLHPEVESPIRFHWNQP